MFSTQSSNVTTTAAAISTILGSASIISPPLLNTLSNSRNSADQEKQQQRSIAADTTMPFVPIGTTASTSGIISMANSNDINGNSRDRTHLTLDFKELKPRDVPNNNAHSPIASFPLSLLDSTTLLLSPEKILFAAQQHHNQQQQQQQPKLLETPTPSNFIFPKNVTTAQESFAEGFQKALQQLQGDGLPTFQNNSPNTVKFLLSLALTPTLSPSAAKAATTFLGQAVPATSAANNCNTSCAVASSIPISESGELDRKLEVPKIVLNHNNSSSAAPLNLASTTVTETLATKATTTADIAKRYMEYFQLGNHHHHHQTASTANSSSANEFMQQVPQFHQPTCAPQTHQPQQHQPQQLLQQQQQSQFIKKEPTFFGGNATDLMMGESSMLPISAAQQIHQNQQQLNGGGQSLACSASIGTRSAVGNSSRGEHQQQNHSRVTSNGMNDIGTNDQDNVKLERKRARNRLAASKCRQRKLQKIAELEQKVEEEKEREMELQDEVVRLRKVIQELQEKLNNTQQQQGINHNNNSRQQLI